ncbi:Receptor-type guanylate cyclase gcy [Seminavis robusta]|uniref:Receptor-type guanylate cyclase gcy n=1 Tax=Seminavis robusta TaxID=568900 RepID=A0A9N8DZM0_9STRA|nr:Receptor-type guanylate cyclase gcy [Seminavis robusta]|eukprot:Sro504_g156060.1 Receptor-type guanylate cyclase gcy (1470) ;mRNA; r:50556-56125
MASVYNILAMTDSDPTGDVPCDGNGNPEGTAPGTSSSSEPKKLLLKFPLVACLMALAAVYLMVQDASHQGFARDFENVATNIQDAFFYEKHLKSHALQNAAATALSLLLAQPRAVAKSPKKLIRVLQALEEEDHQTFQDRIAAMQLSARIDRLTLHPLATDDEEEAPPLEHTCPQGHRKIREHAIRVLQKSGVPVTTETWVRPGETGLDLKSTVLFPIATPAPEDHVLGAVAADIVWADFFHPATFQSEAYEGMILAFENTLGQAFSFRVEGGRLVYLGKRLQLDKYLKDMVVVSNFTDFVRPGGNSNTTQDFGYCGCQFRLRVYPSAEMYQAHAASWPRMLITGTILTLLTLFLSFLAYDLHVTMRHNTVSQESKRFYTIVGSLFPRVVLDRVVQEAVGVDQQDVVASNWSPSAKAAPADKSEVAFSKKHAYLADCHVPVQETSQIISDITKTHPIYNPFPHTTISFMDVVGFTSWCSERDPEQVFKLLETAYQAFDEIANRLNVFKIETVGDCYVAVTGVPEFQQEHCLIMVRFVYEAMVTFIRLVKALEVSLGPGTADLSIRAGIHSGPVIAGVIRQKVFRFQLVGDTMNVASRMETTGIPGRIQLSQDSASLLKVAGKGSWLVQRDEVISVKGKGAMTTYWVKVSPDEARLVNPPSDRSTTQADMDGSFRVQDYESKGVNHERLIDWNTEVLLDLLRKVVARRRAIDRRHGKNLAQDYSRDTSKVEYKKYVAHRSLVNHVAESIPFASYEEGLEQEDPSKVILGRKVVAQVREYVEECASLYNDVAFHNYEHASHVVLSANNLLGQIITPDQGGFQKLETNANGGSKISREFHDRTYGISCDPLMHFAAVQAAMIHDVAHLGVTNKQLMKINKEMAARYDGKSIAEQHSLVLSMHVFANDKYKDLREMLLANDPEETKRYYKFMISSVLATDIADQELKGIRQMRWDDAFEDEKTSKQARDRLQIDEFYLGELNRIEWHFRVAAFVCAILWFVLVNVAYHLTPDDQIVVLEGWERKAEIVAFCFIAVSYMYNAVPYLVKVFDPHAEPMTGAVVGVVAIKTFALVTNGVMAFGCKVPVLIDPVLGTRVHLLRMCEWGPMAFLIYFVSDGVDVPNKELGLKSKYFFALCQGVSTSIGYLFPFAPNATVWGFELFFSVALYLTIYPHLQYKRRAFSKLERGVSADDQEIYDRSQESLKFLETLWVTWSRVVFLFLLEGFGPMVSPKFNFARTEGFGVGWMAFIDCYPKMQYVDHITNLHKIVFDTRARSARQQKEQIRLKQLSNKKATILFEYIIQASDVAHCMQHWGIYMKYNGRLFEEQYRAYLQGHTEDDPRPGWYKGEIWFFENYIIPLARKLCDSGCFGVAGYEYLRSATANLHEWKLKGEEVTAKMIERCESKLGTNRTFWDKQFDNKRKGMKKSGNETSFTDTEPETESDSQEEEGRESMSPRVRVPLFDLHGQVRKKGGE